MFSSTVVLAGTVVIEGVAFRWLVTDGVLQRITVSHPKFGEQSELLIASPDSQARVVGRSMLEARTELLSVGFLEAVEDAVPCGDDPGDSFVL